MAKWPTATVTLFGFLITAAAVAPKRTTCTASLITLLQPTGRHSYYDSGGGIPKEVMHRVDSARCIKSINQASGAGGKAVS